MSSENKVALVTGSTSGIGLATAHALAKRGVNIIVTGFGDETLVNSILGDIRKYGVKADYVSADLSKVTDIDGLWTEVTRLYPDGIDILVNNAGVTFKGKIEDFPEEKWNTTIAVNLSAPFHLIKRSLPSMKKKGWGRIVNMSSAAGFVAGSDRTAYSATKHGLIGLTKGCALENAQFGITCNAVCPSYVETAMVSTELQLFAKVSGKSVDELRAAALSNVPTKTVITPNQVAELVEFLCLSGASSQMTGAAYLIDGGFVAQ